MKPKRLAITISGAVSLGTYEAGVLYEVFTAIEEHNRTAEPQNRIEIDVLTGASAGGMTAAIAAQLLCYGKSPVWEPNDNPFYNPWVKRIDLVNLAEMRNGEDPQKSLFSSDCVSEIARDFLPTTHGTGTRHPIAPQEGDIFLGLALSNLTGVDYCQQALNGTAFTYTRYQDRLIRNVAQASGEVWDEIRHAGLACGAFPFAFRVRELARSYHDYFNDGSVPEWTRTFAYTDGGVFDNQPLGMARNLVAEIDEPGDNDNRYYLFVSPWPKSSSIAKKPLRAEDAYFLQTATSLIKAVFNQGRFQDWIMAESVNRNLEILSTRAGQLATLMLNKNDAVELIGPAVTMLSNQFIDNLPTDSETITIDSERGRLKKEFAGLIDTNGDNVVATIEQQLGGEALIAWLDALLVLEYAGQLRDKAKMVIYDITATDEELAGEGLMAFAGFFDERFRQHDYDVGRKKAQEWIKNLSNGLGSYGARHLGPINYTPSEEDLPVGIDPTLRALQIKDMPVGPRRLLKKVVMNRVDPIVDDYIKAWLVGPMARWWLKRKIADIIEEKLGL